MRNRLLATTPFNRTFNKAPVPPTNTTLDRLVKEIPAGASVTLEGQPLYPGMWETSHAFAYGKLLPRLRKKLTAQASPTAHYGLVDDTKHSGTVASDRMKDSPDVWYSEKTLIPAAKANAQELQQAGLTETINNLVYLRGTRIALLKRNGEPSAQLRDATFQQQKADHGNYHVIVHQGDEWEGRQARMLSILHALGNDQTYLHLFFHPGRKFVPGKKLVGYLTTADAQPQLIH